MPAPTTTVTILTVRAILGAAAHRGVLLIDVLAAHGVDPGLLADDDARVPHALVAALWDIAAERLGDPDFGLNLGRSLPSGAFGLVEYTIRHAPDLRAAFGRLIRYQSLLHDRATYQLTVEGERARLSHVPPPDIAPPRHFGEFLVARFVELGRALVGERWSPDEVSFRHPRPASTGEHARLFGAAELRFGAPVTSMTFARALLDRPVVGADPRLAPLLDRLAVELSERRGGERPFLEHVQREVVVGLLDGVPPAGRTARRLGLSERSFFRRLQQEGTTYQKVVDDVRRELALQRLREPASSLSEIAYALGFADASAFHRAFRRWTGKNPGEWRHHAAAPSAR